LRDWVQHSGSHHASVQSPSIAADDLGSLGDCVVDEVLEEARSVRFGQRSDDHSVLPRQTHLERRHLGCELGRELFGDGLVHEDHLDGCASLSVVGRRAQSALLHSNVNGCVVGDDAEILAL
jgi:hypothetical protein